MSEKAETTFKRNDATNRTKNGGKVDVNKLKELLKVCIINFRDKLAIANIFRHYNLFGLSAMFSRLLVLFSMHSLQL